MTYPVIFRDCLKLTLCRLGIADCYRVKDNSDVIRIILYIMHAVHRTFGTIT